MFNIVSSTLLISALLMSLPVMAASAVYATQSDTENAIFFTAGDPANLLLADAEDQRSNQPESGTLVIPGEEQNTKKKQCLNVCKKWGEDCIINPRTGSRSCRRTCKEFGEECF